MVSNSIDRTTREQLLSALASVEGQPCTFFACPGSTKRLVAMTSCSNCSATAYLQRALKRIGIEIRRDQYGNIQ